ncbi:MAG: protein-glutamate O-methyltransferase CheR, partial [Polaromonas sp.]|nr:protein-glutamate O-methyltransferase CheR [Polaromonas sp.]
MTPPPAAQAPEAPDLQAAASSADIELGLLMEAIYLKYSYDFRDYSRASQKRRVLYALGQLGCPTISTLQSRMLHDPAVFLQLLQYLTIP